MNRISISLAALLIYVTMRFWGVPASQAHAAYTAEEERRIVKALEAIAAATCAGIRPQAVTPQQCKQYLVTSEGNK